MNSSFGRGFNKGFRQSFNNFNKSNFSSFSFNNKNGFSFLNSNLNSQKFKINFANKCFMTKAMFLNSNFNLVGLGSKVLAGEIKNGIELEQLDPESNSLSLGDGMAQVCGLFLVRHGNII